MVLHVGSAVRPAAALAATAGISMPPDDDAEELERLVHVAAAQTGVSVVFVRRYGSPYHELVAVATELRVDAVVVGSSRNAGHRVVGSLAGRLVRDAQWPVTVVP